MKEDFIYFDRTTEKWISQEEYNAIIKDFRNGKIELKYINNIFVLSKKDALYKNLKRHIEKEINQNNYFIANFLGLL